MRKHLNKHHPTVGRSLSELVQHIYVANRNFWKRHRDCVLLQDREEYFTLMWRLSLMSLCPKDQRSFLHFDPIKSADVSCANADRFHHRETTIHHLEVEMIDLTLEREPNLKDKHRPTMKSVTEEAKLQQLEQQDNQPAIVAKNHKRKIKTIQWAKKKKSSS